MYMIYHQLFKGEFLSVKTLHYCVYRFCNAVLHDFNQYFDPSSEQAGVLTVSILIALYPYAADGLYLPIRNDAKMAKIYEFNFLFVCFKKVVGIVF